MNITYYPYTESSDRYFRLEKIAKSLGRKYAHLDKDSDPILANDIIEARKENDELTKYLGETVPVITE